MSIKLKPHNEEVYKKVKKMLAEKNRAAVIQPTGTGKSYVALRLIEQTDGNVIYIAPSTLILNQVKATIEEAVRNGEINTEEYEKYKRVRYITYSKLMRESLDGEQYDQIILDEFHRCGAPEWGKGVSRLLSQNKDSKVLGLTATPLRNTDGKDMARELFDGNIASEMSLEEAIVRGIIKAPVYVNAIYSFEGIISRVENEIERLNDGKLKEEMRQELKRAKDLVSGAEEFQEIISKYATSKDAKYIVFCKNIKEMHKKMVEVSQAFSKIGKVNVFEISSKKRERLNEEALSLFRNAKSGINLLFTVDKLNEGIHVNGIDGVIMLRQTESPIVYMQQLGRALSVGNDGTPLVLDLVNNIENSNYIYGFVEGIEREKRREKEETDKGNETQSSKQPEQEHTIKIVEVQREIKDLLRSINEKLNRDMSISDIVQKYIEHVQGNNRSKESEANIRRYEPKIRQAKRMGQLTLEEIELLESVGFVWRGKELTLEDKIRHFVKYNDRRNERVIREAKRNGLLTEKQILELERAGMVWRGKELTLQDKIRYFIENKEKKYLRDIRQAKRNKWLTLEQMEALENAGIVWRGNELTISDAIRILIKYGDIGSIEKDTVTEEGVPIGKYKKLVLSKCEELSDEDYEALVSAGLVFPKSKELRRLRRKKRELSQKQDRAKKLLEECKSTNKSKKNEAPSEDGNR